MLQKRYRDTAAAHSADSVDARLGTTEGSVAKGKTG